MNNFPNLVTIPNVKYIAFIEKDQIVNNGVYQNDFIVKNWKNQYIDIGGIFYDINTGYFELPIEGIYIISLFLTVETDVDTIFDVNLILFKNNCHNIITSQTFQINYEQNINLTFQYYFEPSDTIYIAINNLTNSKLLIGTNSSNKIVINRLC